MKKLLLILNLCLITTLFSQTHFDLIPPSGAIGAICPSSSGGFWTANINGLTSNIIKADVDGNIVSQFNLNTVVSGIKEYSNGDLLLFSFGSVFTKTQSDGTVVWSNSYSQVTYGGNGGFCLTSDGGFAAIFCRI